MSLVVWSANGSKNALGRLTYTTGALMATTAFHSIQSKGRIENRPCKKGTYKIAKCNAIERMMAPTSMGLCQRKNVRRDSLDESAFMAFNISMTTRIERDTVEAERDISFENISHPISGN